MKSSISMVFIFDHILTALPMHHKYICTPTSLNQKGCIHLSNLSIYKEDNITSQNCEIKHLKTGLIKLVNKQQLKINFPTLDKEIIKRLHLLLKVKNWKLFI